MTSNSQVRALTAADLDQVVALDRQFSGTPRNDFFSKRLKAQQNNPETFISLSAIIDGQVVGFVSCQLLEGEFGSTQTTAVLDAIGVDREYQRRGVGQALFDQLIKEIKAKGGRELQTEVQWDQPELVRFFSDAGFNLAPRNVLELNTEAVQEVDTEGADLSRDRVPMRSLQKSDLAQIVNIDRHITDQDRSAYYERQVTQVLEESGIRVSLVADLGDPVGDKLNGISGFVMARVDYGEFGQTGTEAVIDTIGVDPAARGQNVGQALVSQLITNLKGLRVETVRTEVAWDNFSLNSFLQQCGFRPAQRLALSRVVD